MRSFSEFRLDLSLAEVARAHTAETRSLATWAYLLLRPGMEFVRQRSNFIVGWKAAATDRPALGSWMLLPNLTTPATQTVLPSHDALYGAAHLELDQSGPVRLTVPAGIDERYFSVAVMDAHFNNVAHIGPKWTGYGAGEYLIVPPGWTGRADHVIECPTLSVCLFNRMLVNDGDVEPVRQWQAGLELQPEREADDTAGFEHPDLNTLTDAVRYVRIGLAHLARNPLVEQAEWLSHMVAGIDLADTVAVEAGIDDATAMLDAALTDWPRANGWMLADPALGRPNPQVLRAAAFQQFQIGSNDVEESVYSFVDTDSNGRLLHAGEGRVYDVTFDEIPPIDPRGYWSITMYDEHSRLVDNPIDRYALRPDGPTTIVCCAEQPAEGQWLPAPEGRFRLGLRAYYPTRTDWVPPPVRLR